MVWGTHYIYITVIKVTQHTEKKTVYYQNETWLPVMSFRSLAAIWYEGVTRVKCVNTH